MRTWWDRLDDGDKNGWCQALANDNTLTDRLLDTLPSEELPTVRPMGWVHLGGGDSGGATADYSLSDEFADFLDEKCGEREPSEVPPQ
jgi:hypothetical protein